ncbi:transporter substrate-binding domain-containing protein [Paraburkholderia sp.]|uniref:transporter substrate-binding domain-containing protein n=1 Tax=Paraburkholderia sp. TaxID=1926495 RepID=UPI003D6EDCDE
MRPAVRCRLAALFATACVASAAPAEDLSGTLKKIHDEQTIVLGVRDGSIPFSYFDGQHTVGYSQTIALAIADEVKRTLGLPTLKVREVTVTSTNRLSMLLNSQIDIECGTTAHTRERENQAAFSNSFFVYAVRLIARRDAGIADFADLADKTVTTTAGTTIERRLRQLNRERQLHMRIVSARDHREAFAMVQSSRAVAFVMDEPLLYGFKASDPHPDDYIVTGTPLGNEIYACMFRKGDEPFRRLVNSVITWMQTSGEAEHLYDVWFMQPIPPNGIRLGLPFSPEMRALFAHPNDTPID